MLVVRQRLADELVTLMDGYVTLLQRMAKARRPGKQTPVEAELAAWADRRRGWDAQPPARMSDECAWVPGRDAGATPSAAGSQAGTPPPGVYAQQTGGEFNVVEIQATPGGGGDAGAGGVLLLPPGLALNGFDPALLGSKVRLTAFAVCSLAFAVRFCSSLLGLFSVAAWLVHATPPHSVSLGARGVRASALGTSTSLRASRPTLFLCRASWRGRTPRWAL